MSGEQVSEPESLFQNLEVTTRPSPEELAARAGVVFKGRKNVKEKMKTGLSEGEDPRFLLNFSGLRRGRYWKPKIGSPDLLTKTIECLAPARSISMQHCLEKTVEEMIIEMLKFMLTFQGRKGMARLALPLAEIRFFGKEAEELARGSDYEQCRRVLEDNGVQLMYKGGQLHILRYEDEPLSPREEQCGSYDPVEKINRGVRRRLRTAGRREGRSSGGRRTSSRRRGSSN